MTEKFLRDFLCFKSKTDMLSQSKVWICLYSVFAILFVDFRSFVILCDLKIKWLVLLSIVFFTAFIVPIVIIYKKKSMNISQIFLYEAIIIFGISFEFLYLFILECFIELYVLSISHIVLILIMLCFLILALSYRQKLLKKGKKDKKNHINPKIFSACIGITFSIRFVLKNSHVEILSYLLIILSMIFFIIASMDFQNFIICKRYRFEG